MRHPFCRLILSALALATAACLPVAAAHAAEFKERTIRFAFVQTMDSHWGAGAQRFADLVKQKTGGKIQVKLFPGGTLGGDQQTLSAMQGGILDMTMMGPALLVGQVKEFAVLDLPYLFQNAKEADALLDGKLGSDLIARLPERNVIGLAFWEHGYRNLTNSRRPVAKLEDIKGLKIRTIQVPIYLDMINALGASAVPMPLPELYGALENKAVDGQENPNISIETNKYFEIQKYLSTTQIVYNAIIVMTGKKLWDQLSDDERRVLQEAANETRPHQRQLAREMDAKTLASLKGKGMTITEVTPEERERMRAALKPVTDKYTKAVGETLVNQAFAELEQVRKAAK